MNPKRKCQIKCNDAWREKSFEKWGRICTCCSEVANAVHHFVPKSLSLNLRYDPENGVPLCTGIKSCHYKMHGFDPTETYRLNDLIVKKRGEVWHEYIENNRRVKVKNNIVWLNDTLLALQ